MDNYDEYKKIKDEIKSKLDIVSLVSGYISVKRAGKNYSGLCPFHPEDSPSFYVFPETGTYHCFGCGAHGDGISFIKNYENISFTDALNKAASIAGVSVKIEKKATPPEIILNENINKIFNNNLLSMNRKSEIWKYLEERKIEESDVREFELGYSFGSEVKKALGETMYESEIAVNSGLLKDNQDVFKNRIVIPIRDHGEKLVGFAGRAIHKDVVPKYINTAESDFFKKSKILYLYGKSKNIIKQNDFAIVVEGYFDAISMNRAGYKNVVATLGSSFTKDHAFEISKLTNKIITMYDMDQAGSKATLGTIELLYNRGFQIAVAKYDAKDPDELVKKHDRKYIAEILKKSYKFHEFIIDSYSEKYDLSNEFGLEDYLRDLSVWYKNFIISKRYEIIDPYIDTIAEKINRNSVMVKEILEKYSKYRANTTEKIKKTDTEESFKSIQYHFDESYIYLWIKYPEYREKMNIITPEDLEEGPLREFLEYTEKSILLPEILEVCSESLQNLISNIWKIDIVLEPQRLYRDIKKSSERLILLNKIENNKKKLSETKDSQERLKITSETINLLSILKRHGGN